MSVDAMNWRTTLVPAVIGALAGFLSSRAQEWAKRRLQRRSVAIALHADVERIRSFFGLPSRTYAESMVHGTVQAPITIHRWVERLLPEVATIDARLLSAYLELESALVNREAYIEALRALAARRAAVEGELKEAQESPNPDWRRITELRNSLTSSAESAVALREIIGSHSMRAHERLREIEAALRPFAVPFAKRVRDRVGWKAKTSAVAVGHSIRASGPPAT